MGVLRLQPLLSSSVAERRILLRPAEPSPRELMGDSCEGIYIGRTKMLNTPFYWDYRRLANPHLAVVGMTGSGKSFFIKSFITRAHQLWGTSALILDWSGEYSPWVEAAGGKVINLAKGGGFNILDCRHAAGRKEKQNKKNKQNKKYVCEGGANVYSEGEGATPRAQIGRALSAISIVTALSSNPRQVRFAKEALELAFKKKKISLDRAPAFGKNMPTLQDALKILKSKLQKGEGVEAEAAYASLEQFCPPHSNYFSSHGGLRLDEIIGNGLVSINLSGLSTDIQRSLAALVIMQFVKERMRQEGQSESASLRQIIVADEAWKILQDERSDIVQILREGRKYSFSLITASQNPTDISPTILSNAATLAVFRIMFSEFRDQLSKSLNCDKNISVQMEKFDVGQALFRIALKTPGIYDGPFIISRVEGEELPSPWLLEVGKMKISLERDELKKRLWRLGCTSSQISQISLAFEENDRSLGVEELALQLNTFGLSRSSMLSFLRSLNVPDSAILELFSRIQARSMGVSAGNISNLVVVDEIR